MIVYGHRRRPVHLPAFASGFAARLDTITGRPAHDDLADLLVDFGEVEPAVADYFLPHEDDECEALEPWAATLGALADAYCASFDGDQTALARTIARARTAARALAERTPDLVVHAGMAEGFACYALYPEQYILAARRWLANAAPERLVCVGLRTIGSPLAHIVAAAIRARGGRAIVCTLRPRGHPFDRRVRIGRRLEVLWTAGRFSHALVVDEGPGLSGSSFAAAVDALQRARFAKERVILLPSWDAPESAMRSPSARTTWRTHAHAVAEYTPAWLAGTGEDLSAGRWREVALQIPPAQWPAVQPQHERRKVRARGDGVTVIHRFAGLGRYGRDRLARARLLADAGFGAEPVGLEQGVLAMKWIEGTLLADANARLPYGQAPLIERLATYVDFVRRTFPTDQADDCRELADMLRVNVTEAAAAGDVITDVALDAVDALAAHARTFAEPRVAVDGRLLPHEWVLASTEATSGLLVKVDALDHHGDDFFPGTRDIAWDVAGAIEEFAMEEAAADAFVHRFAQLARDRTVGLRLPFYRAAYLAYRTGYTTLAAESVSDAGERDRFTRAASRYRRSLAARLAHRPDTAG